MSSSTTSASPHPESRRRSARPAALALAALLMTACGGATESGPDDRPLVIATTTVLGDVTRVIAGQDATVEVLMPIGADPHDYQPSARQAARLRSADTVIAIGIGFEERLLGVLDEAAADGVRVTYLGEVLEPVAVHADHPGEAIGDDDHPDDGEATGLDPHLWMDPVRMQTAVTVIADELAAVGDGDFAGRAEDYRRDLEQLTTEITASIGEVPIDRRLLVTDHYSLGYYARRFGLEIVGTVAPAASSSAETSTAGFAHLLEVIAERRVAAIFTSVGEPSAVAEALADEAGVPIVELWTGSLGGPGSGADTYLAMMRETTARIVATLSG